MRLSFPSLKIKKEVNFEGCAEKSQHSRPETATLGRCCLKVSPWLVYGNLDVERVPTNPFRWLTVPKLFVQTIWFMRNTSSPSVILEFWYVLDRQCLHDQSLVKTLSTASLMSSPGWQPFVLHPSMLEELSDPVWLPWERTHGGLLLVSCGFLSFSWFCF